MIPIEDLRDFLAEVDHNLNSILEAIETGDDDVIITSTKNAREAIVEIRSYLPKRYEPDEAIDNIAGDLDII